MRHRIKPTGRARGHTAISMYANGSSFYYTVVKGSDRWDSKGCNHELHKVHVLKSKWAKEKAKKVAKC